MKLFPALALTIASVAFPVVAVTNVGVKMLQPQNGAILVKGGVIRIKADFERLENDSLHRFKVDLWHTTDSGRKRTLAQFAMPRESRLLDTTLEIPASVKPGDFYRLEVRYLPYMLDPKVAERASYGYAVSACIREKFESKKPCEEVIGKK